MKAENLLWSIVRAKRVAGYKFRRQHALGHYIADFICLPARLVIEVDGDSHDDERQLLDAKRTAYLERIGYRVIRFSNSDVIEASDVVRAEIVRSLQEDPSPVPSPLRGEGAR